MSDPTEENKPVKNETAQQDRESNDFLPSEPGLNKQLALSDSDTCEVAPPGSKSPVIYELMLKELDERHQYSRFIAQAYMTWYTFFVTLNLAILGVSVAHTDKIAAFRPFMVASFLIFNLLGVLTTFFIHLGTAKQQGRIDDIITKLNESCGVSPESEPIIKMISPYPHKLFLKLSIVFAASLVVLIISWCIFLIYPA